ncbi:MAG: hypothetical protein JO171_19365 [Paludibacterium sp.]|uniref:hypothetical protein n=1 Tax=Paludibacterium sp. TaxID=1917523 RepID=UPI0025D37B99|nr:hypothetical protein [Paludibacterium sp.]MBV8049317.1 hypothetical protein [Paludibacterium sp.]MBV8646744.1 hypothetical protein [Paludibacterium sp.]
MIVVLLGWLYVVGVFAVAQTSWTSRVSVLLFLGVLPLWLLGRVLQRRRRLRLAKAQNRLKT